jgi:pilus assembly protein FimV
MPLPRTATALLLGCLTCLGAVLATPAQALGIGELELNSRLGQPLAARVMLTKLGGLSTEQVRARLGDNAGYEKRGLDRPGLLNDLKLELKPAAGDRMWVIISSRRPINEPMVPLVLDVRWPDGSLSRDFVILLDPPE